MIKKLILVGALMLGGCATNSQGQVTIDGQTLQQLESAVQADLLTACSFVPTAATLVSAVTTALASGLPEVSIAAGVAIAAFNIAGTTNPPTGICGSLAQAAAPPPSSLKALRKMQATSAPVPSYCAGGKCVSIVGHYVR